MSILLIASIVLSVMGLVAAFVLSYMSDIFLLFGLYCLFSGISCFCILLGANGVVTGLINVISGFVFFNSDSGEIAEKLLLALHVVASLCIVVQCIIDRFGIVFERPQRTNEIEIPAKYARKTPSMFLSEIIIIVSQRFSTRTVLVSNHKGKYRIYYEMDTHMPPPEDGDSYSRVLSAAEAVWLEKQVKKTIRRLDSTWHSRCGGDSMYVEIERNKGRAISCRALSRNYSHLQYELGRLAQFGSYIKE